MRKVSLVLLTCLLFNCAAFKEAINSSQYFQPGIVLENNENPTPEQALVYFRVKYVTVVDGNESEQDFRQFYSDAMRAAGGPFNPETQLPVMVPAGNSTDLPVMKEYLIRFLPQKGRKARIQPPSASMSFDKPKQGVNVTADTPFKVEHSLRYEQMRNGDFVITTSIPVVTFRKKMIFAVYTSGVPGKITNLGTIVIKDDLNAQKVTCLMETEGSEDSLATFLTNQYPRLKGIPAVLVEEKCE